jgi:hypothetical protein
MQQEKKQKSLKGLQSVHCVTESLFVKNVFDCFTLHPLTSQKYVDNLSNVNEQFKLNFKDDTLTRAKCPQYFPEFLKRQIRNE